MKQLIDRFINRLFGPRVIRISRWRDDVAVYEETEWSNGNWTVKETRLVPYGDNEDGSPRVSYGA